MALMSIADKQLRDDLAKKFQCLSLEFYLDYFIVYGKIQAFLVAFDFDDGE